MNTKPNWLDIYQDIKMRLGHELVEKENVSLDVRARILCGAVAELQEHVKWLEGQQCMIVPVSVLREIWKTIDLNGPGWAFHEAFSKLPRPEIDIDGVITNAGVAGSEANEYE